MNHNSRKIIFFYLAFFSILYWLVALNKAFTADDFYSWVYSERLTSLQILNLVDNGIGHPPLYHLLQKIIQNIEILPAYFGIRFVNYIVGMFFAYILIKFLSKFKKNKFYLLSLLSSAAIMNAFVLSRMWGLILLSSLLLIFYAEKYVLSGQKKDLAFILLSIFLGVCSDYNFFIFGPLCLLIILFRTKYYLLAVKLQFIILTILLITSYWLRYGWELSAYFFFKSLLGVFTGVIYSFININFYEILIVSVISIQIFVISYFYKISKSDSKKLLFKNVSYGLFYVLILILIHWLFQKNIVRTVYLAPIFFITTFIILWKYFIQQKPNYKSYSSLLLISISLGILIVLTLNPWFWTNLVLPRYFIIFLPVIIYLVIKSFPNYLVNSVSIVLLFSGLLYLSSNRVGFGYPAPYYKNTENLIFYSPGAYATQYIKSKEDKKIPMPNIIDHLAFSRSCRVCKMGNHVTALDSLDSFFLVKPAWLKKNAKIPGDFIVIGSQKEGLSFIDSLAIKHLTLVYNDHYYLLEKYKKIENNIE